MKYIVLSSEQACKDISRALYRINRPEHLADLQNDTLYLFPWHEHPSTGAWALLFQDDYRYAKHPDVNVTLTAPGDPYGSQALMQALFLPIAADGVNSLQALTQYILTHDVIDTGEVLPHVDPALVKTKAQMDAAGWFPTPEM